MAIGLNTTQELDSCDHRSRLLPSTPLKNLKVLPSRVTIPTLPNTGILDLLGTMIPSQGVLLCPNLFAVFTRYKLTNCSSSA